jgi:hypothetical protein
MALEMRRRSWTTDEYHRMLETGLLGPDDRVELIDGEIVEKVTIGPTHATIVDNLNALLVPLAAGRARVRIQGPVTLPPRSEPEPDVTLLSYGDYRRDHPGPDDVLVVIEVSDTTLAFDRQIKMPLYARSGIPVAWLVDVKACTVEVRTGSGSVDVYGPGDTLAVPGLDAFVTVADVFA